MCVQSACAGMCAHARTLIAFLSLSVPDTVWGAPTTPRHHRVPTHGLHGMPADGEHPAHAPPHTATTTSPPPPARTWTVTPLTAAGGAATVLAGGALAGGAAHWASTAKALAEEGIESVARVRAMPTAVSIALGTIGSCQFLCWPACAATNHPTHVSRSLHRGLSPPLSPFIRCGRPKPWPWPRVPSAAARPSCWLLPTLRVWRAWTAAATLRRRCCPLRARPRRRTRSGPPCAPRPGAACLGRRMTARAVEAGGV